MQERSGTVLVHPVLGLGPRVVDLERRVRYPSLARLAIARRAEREDLSEEMRLLYVAMTRAKERLFITAAFKDPEKTIEKALPEAQPPLAPETLSRAGSMAQWLLLAALADGGRHLGLQVCRADPERTEAPERPRPEADAEALGELRRRLSFRYPHEAAVELPSKVTATELKGRGERDADEHNEQRRPGAAPHSATPSGASRRITRSVPPFLGPLRSFSSSVRRISRFPYTMYTRPSSSKRREGSW